MGRLNTVNRPTLWTKHTDYLTVNGVPGELSKETLSKKTLANRKHSDDLTRIETAHLRGMKALTSDKKAMEHSMLIYSEKMKRISRERISTVSASPPLIRTDARERMSTVSASPPLIRTDASPKEKWPSCTKLDEISDKNIPADTKGNQSPRMRSISDASCYSNLRGKYLSKRRKKISLDMTNKSSELTVLTPSPDGAETSDSGIESPKLGNIRHRRHGVTSGPKQSGTIPEIQTSVVPSDSDKPRIRRLPLIQNFQSNGEQDTTGLGKIPKHSLDFENVNQESEEDMTDGDRLFRIYGKRWNKHPRVDSGMLFSTARDSKSKLKPLIKRSESLDEYDMSRTENSSGYVPEWQSTRRKPKYSAPEQSGTFQAAMQCLSLSEAETSKIGADLELCETDTDSNFDRKIRDISSGELQLLVAQRGKRTSLSSSNSPDEFSDEDEEEMRSRTHAVPSPCQPLKSVLKKPCSIQNLPPDSAQKKCVSFKSPDKVTLIYRDPEEDISETPSGNCFQSQSTIVIVSQ